MTLRMFCNRADTDFLSDHANASATPTPDPVTRPAHYTFGAVEVIDAIEAWGLGFHLGNVVKYVARAAHKGNELQDLKKAAWYLARAIKNLELKKAAAE